MAVSLLLLCTGNLCRSPMAEALFRRRAELCGAPLRVGSAGFATEAQAPPEATLATMRRLGIDLSSHRSRLLTPAMLTQSDLVVGMTRAHVWEAAVMVPEIIPRAFVLGELDRLNRGIGGRIVGEPLELWLERLHDHRNRRGRGPSSGDEIPDPFGRRRGVHARVAGRLQELVLRLGDCAFEPLRLLSDRQWREGRLLWRPNTDRDQIS